MSLKKVFVLSSLVLATAGLAACSHGPTPAEAKELTTKAPTEVDRWRSELAKQGVLLIQQGWRLTFVLPVDRLFEPGTTDLLPSAYPLLERVAKMVEAYAHQTHKPYPIQVWGFADDVFGHTDQYRIAAQYAQSVGSFLWNQGISRQALSIVSKGIEDPVAAQNTTLGRSFNRRVVIQIH
jgi:outer membrane protein OmpA-like peptidoglycan-associated protein